VESRWSKIAVAVILIVAAVVAVRSFWPFRSNSEPRPKKTFWDVVKKDDKRLRSEPPAAYALPGRQAKIDEPPQHMHPNEPADVNQQGTIQQVAKQGTTQQVPKEDTPQYKQLVIEQQVDAERILEMAITERKIARLPGMSYKRMIDYCRDIISRYPESIYAAKARRILGEVPERYWDVYGITEEEVYPGK